MSRRAVAGLIALLGALLGLFLALRGPSKSECQARASILEEDCRFSVLDNADGMVALAQRAWRLPWADAGLVRPSIELSWQAPDGVAILVCTWEP